MKCIHMNSRAESQFLLKICEYSQKFLCCAAASDCFPKYLRYHLFAATASQTYTLAQLN